MFLYKQLTTLMKRAMG